MIKGIDVSSHQGETFPLDGIDFVVVKATEGVSYLNPNHAAQVQYARDHGRVVGHYHYVNGNHPMAEQVDYFLSKVVARLDEFLVLDWEETSVSGADKDEFLKLLKSKAGGRKVLLYCNVLYWKSYDKTSFAADGLWIAQYNNKPGEPSITADWLIHQYTSTPLDYNIAKFASRDEMRKWAGYVAPKPPPKPAPIYATFPGVSFFRLGRTSKLVTAIGKRLEAEGYKGYKMGPGPVWTVADKKAYAWWQRKLGYTGSAADGVPGPASWKKLKVPKV